MSLSLTGSKVKRGVGQFIHTKKIIIIKKKTIWSLDTHRKQCNDLELKTQVKQNRKTNTLAWKERKIVSF
jgi:hypothetical protein